MAKKIILFVEGQTERQILSSFIKRTLDTNIKISIINFKGSGNFIKEIKRKVWLQIQSPQKDDIIFTFGLLDWHGFKDKLPNNVKNMIEGPEAGSQYIENLVHQDKFKMFFAVYELEAWLLSEPDIFPNKIINELKNRISSKRPEEINFNEPPSKLINQLYIKHLNSNFKKVVNGKLLFEELDKNKVLEQCPYFANMISDIQNIISDQRNNQ